MSYGSAYTWDREGKRFWMWREDGPREKGRWANQEESDLIKALSKTAFDLGVAQMDLERRSQYAVFSHQALERARGCIKGLLARTPVRDVEETLAEIDHALAQAPGHASDCAVHNAPALPVGECDCGAKP